MMKAIVFGNPIGKPRMKRGPYKIVVKNKAWFKPKHGMRNSKIYQTWNSMINRCYCPTTTNYKNYGAKGVTVCKRWRQFEFFYEDMGPQPHGLSLDRINPDGNYEPTNCRWATVSQQANNRRTTVRLTFHGITKSVSEWAEEMGIKRDTIMHRIDRCAWSIEKALTTPVRFNARHHIRRANSET